MSTAVCYRITLSSLLFIALICAADAQIFEEEWVCFVADGCRDLFEGFGQGLRSFDRLVAGVANSPVIVCLSFKNLEGCRASQYRCWCAHLSADGTLNRIHYAAGCVI